MTTDKQRITIYLADRRPLDDLAEQLRRVAPLEDRGRISRSTAIEAAIDIVLANLESRLTAVTFSPDGRWLATASRDATARPWTWRVD